MKGKILWDMTQCSLADVYRRFEGAHYRHLQDQRLSKGSYQQKALNKESTLIGSCELFDLLFDRKN
jgi:hypothetical protein